MIVYFYDKKNQMLHVKIHILIEQVPENFTEEQLRKVLSKILIDYAKTVENGKEKIYDSKEWGIW